MNVNIGRKSGDGCTTGWKCMILGAKTLDIIFNEDSRWWIIYDGYICRMQRVFFDKAATFLRDTAMENSYQTYVVKELTRVRERLEEKKQNQADLYFLRNLQVLFECSWQDWLKDEDRKDRLSERGKQHERVKQELEAALPEIIKEAEKNLAVDSVVSEVVDGHVGLELTSKLEQARSEAEMLHQSLDEIIREMRGESVERKRTALSLHACLHVLKAL